MRKYVGAGKKKSVFFFYNPKKNLSIGLHTNPQTVHPTLAW